VSASPVLVCGATGALGLRICELLAAEGRSVRALVRPTAAAERTALLAELDAELVQGDLERPETLARAVDGAEAVVTTASSFPLDPRPDAVEYVDRAGTIALVDAAAAAGVGRFVFISFRPIPYDFPFQRAKRAAEEHLAASGLAYTILRPGEFMEVWFSPALGLDVEGGTVQVFGPGTAPLSWISSGDVARFALWALGAEAARNAVVELGGPEGLSQLEVIALYEEAAGKKLERTILSVEQLEAQLASAPTSVERSLAGVMLSVAGGGVTDMREQSASSGIRLTSVRELAERSASGAPAGA
jgi:uncharacterized protein YbjT (DUF2867 family)